MNDNLEFGTMSLEEYAKSKGTTEYELTKKLRDEIYHKVVFPKYLAIKYIYDNCKDLSKEANESLVETIYQRISKKLLYKDFIYKQMRDLCKYREHCLEQARTFEKLAEDVGINAEKCIEMKEEYFLASKGVEFLAGYLDINREPNEKNISISFLKVQMVNNKPNRFTKIMFPKDSKYSGYYFVCPTDLIEDNEKYIHEEYRNFNENKRWVVAPENMKILLWDDNSERIISITATEIKEAIKPSSDFSKQNKESIENLENKYTNKCQK